MRPAPRYAPLAPHLHKDRPESLPRSYEDHPHIMQLRTFPPGTTPHDDSTYRRPSTRHACLAISLAGTAHLILFTAYVLPISSARVPARMWDGSWESALQQHRHE